MNDNLCTIYIVRHGETKWNVEKRLQGQSDSPLTDNGVFQARELSKQFKDIHFDKIFSSDLLRAQRTAEIVALEKKLAVTTSELIRERGFGRFEGNPFDALKQFDEIMEKLTEEEQFSYKAHPDIESDEEIMERFIRFLREIAVRFPGKNVLVVTHGAILRTFLIHIGFATYKTLPWGKIKNTAYVKIDTDGVDFFVKNTQGVTLIHQED